MIYECVTRTSLSWSETRWVLALIGRIHWVGRIGYNSYLIEWYPTRLQYLKEELFASGTRLTTYHPRALSWTTASVSSILVSLGIIDTALSTDLVFERNRDRGRSF